jgi:hypothetical protein
MDLSLSVHPANTFLPRCGSSTRRRVISGADFQSVLDGTENPKQFLMEELASHGFVVISIDHTYYSGVVAFPDGRVIDARFAPRIEDFEHLTVDQVDAMGDKYAQILARDDSFALDQLQALNQDSASPFFGHLDMAHVGVVGRSLGGCGGGGLFPRPAHARCAFARRMDLR